MNRIAFVATREPSYSRVSIVRRGLGKSFDVDEYVSNLTNYPLRFALISLRLFWAWISGRLRKADAVFVGFFAQPIFPLVRLLYRGPVIADAYFSLFDTMVHDKGKVSERSIVGRFCFWLDSYMLRHAELCFTDTNQHAKYLRTTFGATQSDLRRLWISAENDPLNSHPDALTREPFQVCFWGGFIPLQGVEIIIQAAKMLENENVNFTLFGTGQTMSKCVALSERLKITNLKFKGWQEPEAIARQAAVSHVALGIFGTTAKAGRVIPNKAYEALAMGIPLITRNSEAVRELLRDRENCLLVEPGDSKQLAQKIVWARDHFEEACMTAKRGQELFRDHCSPAEVGQQLVQDIGTLLADRLPDNESERTTFSSAPTTRNIV